MPSKKQFCYSLENARGNLVALHTTTTFIVLKVWTNQSNQPQDYSSSSVPRNSCTVLLEKIFAKDLQKRSFLEKFSNCSKKELLCRYFSIYLTIDLPVLERNLYFCRTQNTCEKSMLLSKIKNFCYPRSEESFEIHLKSVRYTIDRKTDRNMKNPNLLC